MFTDSHHHMVYMFTDSHHHMVYMFTDSHHHMHQMAKRKLLPIIAFTERVEKWPSKQMG